MTSETSPSSDTTSPPSDSTSPPSDSKSPPSDSTSPPSDSKPPPSDSTSPPPPSESKSPPPPPTKTPPPPAATSPPPPTATNPPPPSPPSPTSPSQPSPSTPGGKSPPSAGGGNTSPLNPSNPTTPPSVPSGPDSGSRSGSSPGNVDGGGGGGGGGGGSSSGLAVGIVVAGVVILVVLSVICVYCMKRRKRRRDEYGGEGGYYISPLPPHLQSPVGPKEGYGVQAQHWQQSYHHQQANQYQVSKPPHTQSPSPQPPSPAPPPYMTSGRGSGSGSGSDKVLPPPPPVFGFSNSTFTYDELAMATDGFSDANLLGQGGFGYVHKGVLRNGKEVAVKALKAGSGQGEREFQAEVEIISRVHHKHLVSLVGYCITGLHRLLVYEFVPNRTMEFHLYGKGQPTMDWATRLKIALGAAKGLAYLHEDCHPKIIHRDIKAANILLDYKFETKVADFGLAKISSDVCTHISTRVMGTFGYLAPEYASSGKLTDKSDVFSFGVLLLELITGRRPVDTTSTYMDDSLVDWARPLMTKALEENSYDTLVDVRLQNNFNPNEMARMVACAAASVRHSARRRPRMSQVVRALEGEVSLSDLNDGTQPGHSSMYKGSSDYDSGQYKEDMKKFREMALAGQDYGISDSGGTTSEYGLYPSGSSSEDQSTREMEMAKKMKTDT